MCAVRTLTAAALGLALGLGMLAAATPLHAQAPAAPVPLAPSCGVDKPDFKTTRDSTHPDPTAPPAGMALVYLIEQMPGTGALTSHVRIGVDGRWVTQLSAQTYTSLVIEPGVHHLCASYQGQFAPSGIGGTILHRLNAEAGKTYFLLYRGFIDRDAGEVGFFDEADPDEGRFAMQSADHVTSSVGKR